MKIEIRNRKWMLSEPVLYDLDENAEPLEFVLPETVEGRQVSALTGALALRTDKMNTADKITATRKGTVFSLHLPRGFLAEAELAELQFILFAEDFTWHTEVTHAHVVRCLNPEGEVEAAYPSVIARLEGAQADLEEAQEQLTRAQITLSTKQAQLEGAQETFSARQNELSAEQDAFASAQGEFAEKQAVLETAHAAHSEKQTELETLQGELAERQTALETEQSALSEEQAKLKTAHGTLSSKQTELGNRQTRVEIAQEGLEDAQEALSARQDAFQTRQTQMENNYYALSAKQTEMENVHTAFSERQTELESAQGELAERQTEIENSHAALTEAQSSLQTKQNALTSKQTTLENKQTALETKQTTLETKQTALENKQTTLETKQTTLENKQTALEATCAALVEGAPETLNTFKKVSEAIPILSTTAETLHVQDTSATSRFDSVGTETVDGVTYKVYRLTSTLFDGERLNVNKYVYCFNYCGVKEWRIKLIKKGSTNAVTAATFYIPTGDTPPPDTNLSSTTRFYLYEKSELILNGTALATAPSAEVI